MVRALELGRESIGLGITVLYGLFMLRYLFPDSYRRILAWLALGWASFAALFNRPDTSQLNRMWDIGGLDV
jgi:hypothetical protein